MLKRQRTSSPIPWPMEQTVEADVAPGDLYEPDRKRRRYFTASNLDKSLWMDLADGDQWDGEVDDAEDRPRKRREGYASGANEWRQQAGQYKDANTLLHDLHAEQRHRMIFAAVPSLHNAPHAHSLHIPTQHTASDVHDDSSQQQPRPVEAKRVTERYEDTNNRRRQLDPPTTPSTPPS
ncbi:hypothetical protein BC629DRAFT_1591148 [Irpex lacteus]|nr:hypothetical protein BC629DRAFT_1591148 [Irpex lacteus]